MPTLDDLAASISERYLKGHVGELVLVVYREKERGILHVVTGMIEMGDGHEVEWMALGILTGEDLISAGDGEYHVPVAYHALWTPRSITPVRGPICVDRLWQYYSMDDAAFETSGMKIYHPCSIITGNNEAIEAFQREYDPYAVVPRRYSTIEQLYLLATYAGARDILDTVPSEM